MYLKKNKTKQKTPKLGFLALSPKRFLFPKNFKILEHKHINLCPHPCGFMKGQFSGIFIETFLFNLFQSPFHH